MQTFTKLSLFFIFLLNAQVTFTSNQFNNEGNNVSTPEYKLEETIKKLDDSLKIFNEHLVSEIKPTNNTELTAAQESMITIKSNAIKLKAIGKLMEEFSGIFADKIKQITKEQEK